MTLAEELQTIHWLGDPSHGLMPTGTTMAQQTLGASCFGPALPPIWGRKGWIQIIV